MKRYVKEPTYKQYINFPVKRFNEKNNAFCRGLIEGNKYEAMHKKGIENIKKQVSGKSILEHSMWVAGRTINYILKSKKLAREGEAIYNYKYRLKDPDPKAMALIIKKMAHWLGADLVGITKLNPAWVYSNWGDYNTAYLDFVKSGDPVELPSEYDKVIVMAHAVPLEQISKSPDIEAGTDLNYSRASFSSTSMATFIRELGYKAIPAVNKIALNIPLAVDAGLGELGRNGLLITPEYGPGVQICKVFTNLPLDFDLPICFGIQKFCEKCKLCSDYCASGAICDGRRTDKGWDKSNLPGLSKWPIKAMECFNFWVENGNHCSVCIRVCPFTRFNPVYHSILNTFSRIEILTKILVSLHEFLGIGKKESKKILSNFMEIKNKKNNNLL